MKKIMIAICALALTGSVMASNGNESQDDKMETVSVDSRYTIVNDTDEKVRIHTGYGETTLNPRGGKTSVRCESGKSVKVNGKVIYKVDSDMCGGTVKLSEYL